MCAVWTRSPSCIWDGTGEASDALSCPVPCGTQAALADALAGDRMKITVKTVPCMGCEKSSVLEVDANGYRAWKMGAFLQHVLPELSDDERELLMTGTCPECWHEMFADDEED